MVRKIFKVIFHFIIAIFIMMFLIAAHSSSLNLLWLSSMNMPVTVSTIIDVFYGDFRGLLFGGAFPVPVLIAFICLILFLLTGILRRWLRFSPVFMYAMSGLATFLVVTVVLPLGFNNIDLIANARTGLGKSLLCLFGAAAGTYFGFFVGRSKDDEQM